MLQRSLLNRCDNRSFDGTRVLISKSPYLAVKEADEGALCCFLTTSWMQLLDETVWGNCFMGRVGSSETEEDGSLTGEGASTGKRDDLGKQASGMDGGRWDSYFVFRSRWDSKNGRKPLMSAAKSRTQFSYIIFCAWSSFRRRIFSNLSSEYSYIPRKANQYTQRYPLIHGAGE